MSRPLFLLTVLLLWMTTARSATDHVVLDSGNGAANSSDELFYWNKTPGVIDQDRPPPRLDVPGGFVDGPNLYAYVRQNPWTSFDPEGLESESERNWHSKHDEALDARHQKRVRNSPQPCL